MRFLIIWTVMYFSVRCLTKAITALSYNYISSPKWRMKKINLAETAWQEEQKKLSSGLIIGSIFRCAMVAGLFSLADGWVPVYYNITDYGWLYFLASILAYALYFDLWFYISHRFVFHNRILYKASHLIHHRFRDPVNPVRNTFSISEVVITSIGCYAIVLVMPFHPIALLIGRIISYPK